MDQYEHTLPQKRGHTMPSAVALAMMAWNMSLSGVERARRVRRFTVLRAVFSLGDDVRLRKNVYGATACV